MKMMVVRAKSEGELFTDNANTVLKHTKRTWNVKNMKQRNYKSIKVKILCSNLDVLGINELRGLE